MEETGAKEKKPSSVWRWVVGNPRIIALSLVALGAIYAAVAYVSPQVATLHDSASEATVLGGMLTLFGIIFSAFYSEISSYYKTLSSNKKRKFKIIYPLITKFYVPWMSSASQLARNIDSVDEASPTTDALAHVLYLILVFYGYRLRFVREGGGYVLLDSAADSLSVREAYSRVVASFDWASANTALKTSKLQLIFLSKDTKKQPYVQYLFLQDLKDDAELQQMLLDLKNWIAEGKGRETAKRLWVFEKAFGEAIDKFYSTWNP